MGLAEVVPSIPKVLRLIKQTVKDTYNSFVRYFKKLGKYPNRKSYKDKKKSFYVDPFKIEFTSKKVRLEKIANNQKSNRQVLNWIRLLMKKGIIGRYNNVNVTIENLLPTKSSVRYNFLRTGKAFAFAEQIDQIKAVEKERGFGDIVKGLYVFGGVVVRAKEAYAIQDTLA